MHTQYISREQLERELNLTLSDRLILATFHPATLDEMPPQQQCKNLLAALDRHPDYQTIFTYPNNDSEGRIIIQLIESYRRRHPERVAVFPSLGMRRYLSMLHCATAVVGNSSSGIVEVPSIGIPTLDIGIRQMGRTAAPSVLHCGVSEEEIADGLETVLSSSFRLIAKSAENPYYLPDTLEKMVDAIVNTPLDNIIIKPFYDVKFK